MLWVLVACKMRARVKCFMMKRSTNDATETTKHAGDDGTMQRIVTVCRACRCCSGLNFLLF